MEGGEAIPFIGPPILSFLASSVRGLTGFGDGIAFQALWSVAAALSIMPSLDRADTLRHVVLFSTIMQSISMPIQVWQSRKALRGIAGYSAIMAVVGMLAVIAGAHVLLSGEPKSLRISVGVLLYIFSVVSLADKARSALNTKYGIAAATASEPKQKEDPAEEAEDRGLLPSTSEKQETSTILAPAAVVTAESVWVPAGVILAAQKFDEAHPKVSTAIESIENDLPPSLFPPLSPVVTPKYMLILLVVGSVFSGFLGGLFGAGGPPLMLVYAQLKLDKDDLRGFCVAPSMFMIARLIMYIASPGSVFDLGNMNSDGADGASSSGDLLLYAAIMLGSICGISLGSAGRKFVDAEILLVLILLIVFVAAALMLHAEASAGIAALFVVTALIGCSIFCALWRYGFPTLNR